MFLLINIIEKLISFIYLVFGHFFTKRRKENFVKIVNDIKLIVKNSLSHIQFIQF